MTTATALTLFLLALGGGAAGAAERERELHVYVLDCVGLGDELLEAMRTEVEDIYSDTGIRIVWLEERPPEPAKSHEAAVYILDELPPALRSLLQISKGSAPMAMNLGPRPTEPAALIYVSRKAVLGRASFRHAIVKDHMVRAFGRTIAHELAHRFLRSSHTEEGILKPTLSGRELIDGDSSDMFFTTGQMRLLHETAKR